MPTKSKKAPAPRPALTRVRLDLDPEAHAALSVVAGYRRQAMSAVAREAVARFVEAELKRLTTKPTP